MIFASFTLRGCVQKYNNLTQQDKRISLQYFCNRSTILLLKQQEYVMQIGIKNLLIFKQDVHFMENHLLQIPSPILKIMLVRTSVNVNVLIKTGILLLLTSFLDGHILCNILLSSKSYSTISILDVTFTKYFIIDSIRSGI